MGTMGTNPEPISSSVELHVRQEAKAMLRYICMPAYGEACLSRYQRMTTVELKDQLRDTKYIRMLFARLFGPQHACIS